MSLLFLTNVLDAFQALDDSGRPLPGAVLTFWRSGTVIPEAVYADQDLLAELSDAQGHVVADSQGRFELIYLRDTSLYRVRLQTAQGVLRWDVDPYLCDCTTPPRLFRAPVHQALTKIADEPPTFAPPPKPGASLRFTLAGTDEPRDTWADAARSVPHPNPLRANAGGFFPPVYLDDVTAYRIRLETLAGAELLDIDPYECQCGFRLLTSKAYAYEAFDQATASSSMTAGAFMPVFEDDGRGSLALLSGSLQAPLISYTMFETEAGTASFSMQGGNMIAPLVFYTMYETEAGTGSFAMQGGNMIAPLVFYDQWPTESGTGSLALLNGSLA